MRFEIRNASNREYYWRLVASNGETLAHSETYTTKRACRDTVESVKDEAGDAAIADET